MRSSDLIIADNERFLTDYGHDIQAGIFTPHRFDHVLLLFLRLEEPTAEHRKQVNALLRSLAVNKEDRKGLYLCTTAHQRQERREVRKDPDIFCNLYFTAEGLTQLGVGRKHWKKILDHLRNFTTDLGQEHSNPEKVHAMLLLAHPKADALRRKKADLMEQYFRQMGIRCVHSETGRVYRRRINHERQRRGFAIEHFGYADGLSNPWVMKQDAYLNGKPRSRDRWDPTASYKEFVVDEPGGKNRWGSYLVYRKYRQFPERFAKKTREIARATGETEEAAGALLFGRRRDGSSLEFEAGSKASEELSDFDFSTGKCPLFAHTRKVNERDHPKKGSPKRLTTPILRRGITYGDRPTDPYRGGFARAGAPEDPVGLLFMSFQNDIGKFQQLLERSSSAPCDPLLGSLGKPEEGIQIQLDGLDEPIEIAADEPLVSLLGGLNLYAPSISFFKDLAAPTSAIVGKETPIIQRGIGHEPDTTIPSQNKNAMKPALANIPIFGQDRYAFLYALKYYNDTKVGYDGAIVAYSIQAAYTINLPDGPTVPVRDQHSLRVLMQGLQGLENSQEEALGFTFEVPLRKGHEANIDVTLTSWDGTETLASQKINNCRFNGPNDHSPEVMAPKPEDEYGFVRITLNKHEAGDLADPNRFLQKKIERWWNKPANDDQTPAITNCLFILRVKQIVWPSHLKIEAIKTNNFECRDDSIILEIQEGAVQEPEIT